MVGRKFAISAAADPLTSGREPLRLPNGTRREESYPVLGYDSPDRFCATSLLGFETEPDDLQNHQVFTLLK